MLEYCKAEFHDLNDGRKLFDTNFFGMVDMTQLYLPLLREYQGRVVMISSISGRIGFGMGGIYASSKFAVEAYSYYLRREVSPFQDSLKYLYLHQVMRIQNCRRGLRIKLKRSIPSTTLYSETYNTNRRKSLTLASNPKLVANAIKDAVMSMYSKYGWHVSS